MSAAVHPAARWLSRENVLLAFVAGYVDTLGFVALFGLFVAHVTGNFILVGAGIAGAGGGVLIKLLAFPAFVTGIVAARWTARRGAGSSGNAAGASDALYALQVALLAAFMIAGLIAAPISSIDAPLAAACGLLGAAGMGVQNAHAKLSTRSIAANTVMTGNVTQAVLDACDWLAPGIPAEQRRAARERLAKMLPPVLAFALGAGG
ncbi:YoaK family protein, partial [Burkholderia sp. Ac-20379]|uniref:YoaK family protein n=1 Tax=Burkholderia sp. Ac-20379 TaxID=2703900 RepID=UPI00198014B5